MAVITISRQLGSGDEAIALKVSEALRYAYKPVPTKEQSSDSMSEADIPFCIS